MEQIDEIKLRDFVGTMPVDLGGALSVPLLRIGEELELYKLPRAHEPVGASELATKVGIAKRYVSERFSARTGEERLREAGV